MLRWNNVLKIRYIQICKREILLANSFLVSVLSNYCPWICLVYFQHAFLAWPHFLIQQQHPLSVCWVSKQDGLFSDLLLILLKKLFLVWFISYLHDFININLILHLPSFLCSGRVGLWTLFSLSFKDSCATLLIILINFIWTLSYLHWGLPEKQRPELHILLNMWVHWSFV